MHMQRDVKPTILSSLEYIVDQVGGVTEGSLVEQAGVMEGSLVDQAGVMEGSLAEHARVMEGLP